jgi:hypothetical protein
MRAAAVAGILSVLAAGSGCARTDTSPGVAIPTPTAPAPPPVTSTAPPIAPAPPSPETSSAPPMSPPQVVPVPPPRASPPKVAAPAPPPQTPVKPMPREAPSPSLDFAALETRLRATKAMGVFTKLALKNQIDDLLHEFKLFHQGRGPARNSLRERYELLLLKVLSLLQNDDAPLARDVSASREQIWAILVDPEKFAKLN